MLVHEANGLGGPFRKSKLVGNRGTPVAPDLEQLFAAARTKGGEAGKAAKADTQRRTRIHVRQGVANLFVQPTPVAQPHRPFGRMVVAAKQLVHSAVRYSSSPRL